MREFYLFVFFSLLTCSANSQILSLDDLLKLTALPEPKFDHFLTKKGFHRQIFGSAGQTSQYIIHPKVKVKRKRKSNIYNSIEKFQDGKIHSVVFQTSSAKEYSTLKEKLKNEGFIYKHPVGTTKTPLCKKNFSVLIDTATKNKDTLFSFRFSRKELPTAAQIQYAEDLLQFNSHSELATVFGERNLKKDLYFFTEKEIKPCTVLFPHSSRQAVFIWLDDSSSSELVSVIIGGSLQIASEINNDTQVAENSWPFNNGIRCNMGLKELLIISENKLEFYGRQSRYFLSVVPGSMGKIDLHNLTLILGCLNCRGTKILDAHTVNANEAVAEGLGMFVMMVMLTPDEPKDLSRNE